MLLPSIGAALLSAIRRRARGGFIFVGIFGLLESPLNFDGIIGRIFLHGIPWQALD